jgi:hypothetical protein
MAIEDGAGVSAALTPREFSVASEIERTSRQRSAIVLNSDISCAGPALLWFRDARSAGRGHRARANMNGG